MYTPTVDDIEVSLPGSSSQDELSFDSDTLEEITERMKHALDELYNPVGCVGLPSASKLHLDEDPRMAKIPGCTSVVEFMRDDAFPLALQAKNRYHASLLREANIPPPESVEDDDIELSTLTRAQYKIVNDISEKKSKEIGSQLHALYDLLTASKQINTPKGKQIIRFALDIINLEENATDRMGELLLLTQRNITEAFNCASADDFETALINLEECCISIFETASDRIHAHSSAHKSVALQNYEEAAYLQMSIEMADLLLLNNGVLNFGIVESLKEILIPEKWKAFKAIETLEMILDDITENPMIWKEIASIMPPESPENPSCEAIRDCFGYEPKQAITRRDAQKFIVSALLAHYRQAKVGSCFATACLIKALHHHLLLYIRDLKQLTEKGMIQRVVMGELRSFPYHARVGKEFLDTIIEVNPFGRITYTMSYDLKPYKQNRWQQPDGTHIYKSPGIIAACRALGIDDVKSAVMMSLDKLPQRLAVEDIIKELVAHAFNTQESQHYHLRSTVKLTREQMLARAEFAFGVQTSHPLHLAYDQTAASMVNYFNSQYYIPAQIYHNMEEILQKSGKGYPMKFQAMYRKLLQEMFLPMIIRLRFRYNPYIEHSLRLFNDENYGRESNSFYGYEAFDGGLPEDFVYSTELLKQYKNNTSTITLQRFQKYPSEHFWKPIRTEETFRNFISDLVKQTGRHIISTSSAREKREWITVIEKMCRDIKSSKFSSLMVYNILGKESKQKKKWIKNPYTISTTPWMFRWGGDFNEVMKSYFDLDHSPSKLKNYNGTPKEVLAKCINFIKQQPDQIRDQLDAERSMYLITSPVHAFLLIPNEGSFQAAWKSPESTNDYISRVVEAPGIAISKMRLSSGQKKAMIDFIANQSWITNSMEKDDYDRLQLTDHSKAEFDRLLSAYTGIFDLPVNEFYKVLMSIVAASRANDPRIGRRNPHWESRFSTRLKNFIKSVMDRSEGEPIISHATATKIIDFARNYRDTIYLSSSAIDSFLRDVEMLPETLNIKDFRNTVTDCAYKAYENDLHGSNVSWKSELCCEFDTKLFEILSQKSRTTLIKSAIITHDPNWKDGIHDSRCMFMVNPSTAKIEFCKFCPDTNRVSFMKQGGWFPRSSGDHGYWNFPDNYRVYATEPLFNAKRHT